MTTPAPTRPTDRIAAGLAATAATTAAQPEPLTSGQAAYLAALRTADARGEKLTPNQRMTLGLLTQQHDAAQAVAQ